MESSAFSTPQRPRGAGTSASPGLSPITPISFVDQSPYLGVLSRISEEEGENSFGSAEIKPFPREFPAYAPEVKSHNTSIAGNESLAFISMLNSSQTSEAHIDPDEDPIILDDQRRSDNRALIDIVHKRYADRFSSAEIKDYNDIKQTLTRKFYMRLVDREIQHILETEPAVAGASSAAEKIAAEADMSSHLAAAPAAVTVTPPQPTQTRSSSKEKSAPPSAASSTQTFNHNDQQQQQQPRQQTAVIIETTSGLPLGSLFTLLLDANNCPVMVPVKWAPATLPPQAAASLQQPAQQSVQQQSQAATSSITPLSSSTAAAAVEAEESKAASSRYDAYLAKQQQEEQHLLHKSMMDESSAMLMASLSFLSDDHQQLLYQHNSNSNRKRVAEATPPRSKPLLSSSSPSFVRRRRVDDQPTGESSPAIELFRQKMAARSLSSVLNLPAVRKL